MDTEYMDQDIQEIYNLMNTPSQVAPTTGLGDEASLLNVLLDKDEVMGNKQVPAVIKNVMAFYHKTLALTNIRREDIFTIMSGFDDLKVSHLMSRNKSEYTWIEETYWTALRRWLWIEAHRAIEGFERTMETTQIQQIESNQQHEVTNSSSGGMSGFINRVRGK